MTTENKIIANSQRQLVFTLFVGMDFAKKNHFVVTLGRRTRKDKLNFQPPTHCFSIYMEYPVFYFVDNFFFFNPLANKIDII